MLGLRANQEQPPIGKTIGYDDVAPAIKRHTVESADRLPSL
jgi:hypothetical protein